jgi:hypothetical protein
MTTSATRQEQRVVTQEVRATSTVLANDSQVKCTYESAGNKIKTDLAGGSSTETRYFYFDHQE